MRATQDGARGELDIGPELNQRLVSFAQRFVGDHHQAEDVAQETLVRARRGWSRRRDPSRTEAWLFRICRHTAIDLVRWQRVRRGVWTQMPDEGLRLARAPEPVVAPWLPRGVLRALPATQRLLLEMHYGLGLRQPSICRFTGLTAAALRVRLHRARGTLVGGVARRQAPSTSRLSPRERRQCA